MASPTAPAASTALDRGLPAMLLVLTAVTGVVDAVSYLALGHVFTANMTGNVVFLGFWAGGAPDFSVVLSLLAIVAFMLGAVAGGRLGRKTGGHRGRLFAVSSAVQTAAVGGALLVSLGLFGLRESVSAHVLVLLLAFAMGLQTASARLLGVADLTTVVLTLTVTALSTDPIHPNTGRRLAAVAAMFVGALAGAVLILQAGMGAALAFALALLLLNTLAGWRWSSSTDAWTTAK
jgi:uncharacterized membrane protein YoaK (UPF0700 family)